MNNDSVTPQQVAELIRLGEMHANNQAQILWARFAFTCLGLFLILATVFFVWWNYGLHNATWIIVLIVLLLGLGGWAALVSEWNDRTQERALRMMQTQMSTTAQLGQGAWTIDPKEMRRQNALTIGTQDRALLTQAPTGFVFDDDDIIEVKPS